MNIKKSMATASIAFGLVAGIAPMTATSAEASTYHHSRHHHVRKDHCPKEDWTKSRYDRRCGVRPVAKKKVVKKVIVSKPVAKKAASKPVVKKEPMIHAASVPVYVPPVASTTKPAPILSCTVNDYGQALAQVSTFYDADLRATAPDGGTAYQSASTNVAMWSLPLYSANQHGVTCTYVVDGKSYSKVS